MWVCFASCALILYNNHSPAYDELFSLHLTTFCRACTVLQHWTTKPGCWGGRFSHPLLWAIQVWAVGAVEEKQAAAESQQEVRDKTRRIPAEAPHQGARTWGQWQLLVPCRKCGDNCKADSKRWIKSLQPTPKLKGLSNPIMWFKNSIFQHFWI